MVQRASWFKWGVSAAVLAAAVPSAFAVTYTAIDLHNVLTGFDQSFGYSLTPGTRVGYGTIAGDPFALRWDGPANTPTNINPATYLASQANGVAGNEIAGTAVTGAGDIHAGIWNLTTNVFTEIHPAGATASEAVATNGSKEVGAADSLAALWSGTAASYVPLHPSITIGSLPVDQSMATSVSTDGTQQAGWALESNSGQHHAVAWAGTAASAVDLNQGRSDFSDSQAFGVDSHHQVGSAFNISTGFGRAILWNDTAASGAFLPELGYETSEALGILGSEIVGDGTDAVSTDAHTHALVWDNLGTTVTDLHPALTAISSFYTDSIARAIDANGWIVGQANYDDGSGAVSHAILWIPSAAPEPASLGLLGLGAVGLLRRRKS